MYLTNGVTLPRADAWSFSGLGQPIDASTGTDLLNAVELARAIRENRRQGEQLRWKDRYLPISWYYLRFRNRAPGVAEFAQAVARWQQAVGGGLTPTGIIGPRTWRTMRPRGESNTFTTGSGIVRPNSFNQVLARFGDPRRPGHPNQLNPAWESANIVNANAPTGRQFIFNLPTGPIVRPTVRVHQLIRNHFEAVFVAIEAAGLWDDIQPVSGPFNFRPATGGGQLSMHAFGIAIDINPAWYSRRLTAPCFPNPRVIEIFQDHGFHWGMFFPTPDPMHFQFATGA
jgi:D-alanyl-D-alanine carboxypeptidase-like protein